MLQRTWGSTMSTLLSTNALQRNGLTLNASEELQVHFAAPRTHHSLARPSSRPRHSRYSGCFSTSADSYSTSTRLSFNLKELDARSLPLSSRLARRGASIKLCLPPRTMSSPSRLSLQPRRSSHDESTSPAPIVAQALALKPFPTRDARRDTSVALSVFKDAWKALGGCTVLSQSCRTLGERAAEVLLGASEALRDAEEREAGNGVPASKRYEFEGKASAATVFAVKS